MYLTWYGTNTLKFENDNTCILIDPFIRYDKRNDKEFINNFDVKHILITHGHVDHTVDLPFFYKDKKVKIYCTNAPYNRLKELIDEEKLVKIKPEDKIKINNMYIKVLKSKHIKFDFKLCLSTLLHLRIIKYHKNLSRIVSNHFECEEKGETVAYHLRCNKLSILILGSMNLDSNTKYPIYVDYLILPYQGNSKLEEKAKEIVNIIKPKNIILSHFDNSFPPISKEIDTSKLKDVIDKNINIIKPIHDEKIKL